MSLNWQDKLLRQEFSWFARVSLLQLSPMHQRKWHSMAKDTLELQGSINKESEVNKINKDSERVPKGKDDVKSKSHCYRCGVVHESAKCYFRNETCRKCGKLGHILRVCHSGKSQNSTRRWRDEKPNLHSFEVDDECDDDSLVTLARLQRYALFLAGFEYSIEYKNTTQHGNAHGLSCLSLKKACDKEVP